MLEEDAASLDELITNTGTNWWRLAKDDLPDPSYRRADPVTVGRIERWLKPSARVSDGTILSHGRILTAVGEERKEADIAPKRYRPDEHHRPRCGFVSTVADPVEQAAQLALLDAVIGSARMVLSVSYVARRKG